MATVKHDKMNMAGYLQPGEAHSWWVHVSPAHTFVWSAEPDLPDPGFIWFEPGPVKFEVTKHWKALSAAGLRCWVIVKNVGPIDWSYQLYRTAITF